MGVIRPLFFLLPNTSGLGLRIKLYDDVSRIKGSIDPSITRGSSQRRRKNERSPEQIIKHYGPATWNPHEPISGAREPIYNLYRIIQLLDVLEIITNQSATALDSLAEQAAQMQTAILQHRLVLHYLLAEEGGVYGKLNDSNCCLKIYDNWAVVKKITSGIHKLTRIPVQTWNGWEFDMWSWLPGEPLTKRILYYLN